MIFLVALALLWDIITGGHGIVLQVIGIIGLVLAGSFILGMCMILTVPAAPYYQLPGKALKKEEADSRDVGKVVGTAAKVAFFPLYGIFAFGAVRRRRKKKKSEEFFGRF